MPIDSTILLVEVELLEVELRQARFQVADLLLALQEEAELVFLGVVSVALRLTERVEVEQARIT